MTKLLKLKILTLLLVFNQGICYCQYDAPFLPEFFFWRQPSARAEAMGKAYTSVSGDLGCIHFNPAGISKIKPVELNTSYTPPNNYLTKGYYTYAAAGININRYLQLAASHFRFDFGKTQIINVTKRPFEEKFVFTIASEPLKKFQAGVNVNYFNWQQGLTTPTHTVFLDAGLLKEFTLKEQVKFNHAIKAGASISNFNFASIKDNNLSGMVTTFKLPVITRLGFNYEVISKKSKKDKYDNDIRIMLISEYQLLLNSKYRSGLRLGGEFSLYNVISLRAGWYNEKVFNHNFPDINKSVIQDFTYGLGLRFPIYRITNFPITVNFDYTSLPQVSYRKDLSDLSNFRTFSLHLEYNIKRKVSKPNGTSKPSD